MTSRDSMPVEPRRMTASRACSSSSPTRLIGLARCHLDARLQNKVDPEDVVQSAYKSFFLRYGDQSAGRRRGATLWSLLTLITLRKCADRAAVLPGRSPRHEPGGRCPRREPAGVLARGGQPRADAGTRDGLGGDGGKVLREVVADERQVVELSLQGYSTQEISEQLSRAERSVRRLRERVRKYLEQLQEQEAEDR